jgi:hypothetical protein
VKSRRSFGTAINRRLLAARLVGGSGLLQSLLDLLPLLVGSGRSSV